MIMMTMASMMRYDDNKVFLNLAVSSHLHVAGVQF